MSEKYIDLEVKEVDIKNGERGNCFRCAISLAAKRQFPGKYVYTRSTLNVDFNHFKSKKMLKFIKKFDNEEPVKPTKFRLRKVA